MRVCTSKWLGWNFGLTGGVRPNHFNVCIILTERAPKSLSSAAAISSCNQDREQNVAPPVSSTNTNASHLRLRLSLRAVQWAMSPEGCTTPQGQYRHSRQAKDMRINNPGPPGHLVNRPRTSIVSERAASSMDDTQTHILDESVSAVPDETTESIRKHLSRG